MHWTDRGMARSRYGWITVRPDHGTAGSRSGLTDPPKIIQNHPRLSKIVRRLDDSAAPSFGPASLAKRRPASLADLSTDFAVI